MRKTDGLIIGLTIGILVILIVIICYTPRVDNQLPSKYVCYEGVVKTFDKQYVSGLFRFWITFEDGRSFEFKTPRTFCIELNHEYVFWVEKSTHLLTSVTYVE